MYNILNNHMSTIRSWTYEKYCWNLLFAAVCLCQCQVNNPEKADINWDQCSLGWWITSADSTPDTQYLWCLQKRKKHIKTFFHLGVTSRQQQDFFSHIQLTCTEHDLGTWVSPLAARCGTAAVHAWRLNLTSPLPLLHPSLASMSAGLAETEACISCVRVLVPGQQKEEKSFDSDGHTVSISRLLP